MNEQKKQQNRGKQTDNGAYVVFLGLEKPTDPVKMMMMLMMANASGFGWVWRVWMLSDWGRYKDVMWIALLIHHNYQQWIYERDMYIGKGFVVERYKH